MVETRKSYCRFCHAYCALDVDVEDNRVVAVRGDRTNPMFGGFTCVKGRQLPEALNHPERIRKPLRRRPDGSFEEISKTVALDEIAGRLEELIRSHGPRSVASYCGTYAFQESAALAVSRSFHQGIDSPNFHTSVTIDQPAKFVAMGRLGVWGAGPHSFESADVVLLVGNNPLVSVYSPVGGVPPYNPYKRLRDAQRRGLRVICVDPRRTEIARRADLFLQIKPGEDPALLAGMLRVVLDEGLHDVEFCDAHVNGLSSLRTAVAPYDPATVEARTGIARELVVEAARLFARGPRGSAVAGTGPDMAPNGNLTEHLVATLNSILGRFNRAGEAVANPGVLSPRRTPKAQAYSPSPAWGSGPRSRVRGLGQVIGEMPTAALSDEILLPGEGQVRALLAVGGNPVAAWPDQLKTLRAMDALELLVSVDIKLSATARRAHYVLPPKMCLEREDVPILNDTWFPEPYSQYAEAVIDPDPDLLEEWEVFWELASRLGAPLRLAGGELDLERKPSKFEVLERMLPGSRVPLAEIRERAGAGILFEEVEETVAPAADGHEGRLEVAPADVVQELRDALDAKPADGFPHLLISRRLLHVYNSAGRDLKALRERGTTNQAFMNPADLDDLGLRSGDLVEIESDHARILGVVEASDELRPGVVSMAHAWGDGPEDDTRVREIGSSTNRLVNNARDFDPITGMARQSAIPVRVQRVAGL